MGGGGPGGGGGWRCRGGWRGDNSGAGPISGGCDECLDGFWASSVLPVACTGMAVAWLCTASAGGDRIERLPVAAVAAVETAGSSP